MAGASNRVLSSAVAFGVGRGITTLVQFIRFPVLLPCWGVGLVSDWLVLSAVAAFATIASGGIVAASATEMVFAANRQDTHGSNAIFRVTTLALAGITGVFLLLMVGLVSFVSIDDALGLTVIDRHDAGVIALVMAFQFPVSQLLCLVVAAFRASNLHSRGIMWWNCNSAIYSVSVLLVASFGGGLVLAAVTQLVLQCLVTLLSYHEMRHKTAMSLGLHGSSWKVFRHLLSPSLSYLSFPFGYVLRNQGTVVLIAKAMSAEAVVVFSALRTLTNFGTQLVDVASHSIIPEISRALAQKDCLQLRDLNRTLIQSVFGISLVVTAGQVVFGPLVYRAMVSGKFECDFSVFYILLIAFVFKAAWLPAWTVAVAGNTHKSQGRLFLLLSIGSLFASYYLMGFIGLSGCAVAVLVVEVLFMLAFLRPWLDAVGDTPKGAVAAILELPQLMRGVAKLVSKRLGNLIE